MDAYLSYLYRKASNKADRRNISRMARKLARVK